MSQLKLTTILTLITLTLAVSAPRAYAQNANATPSAESVTQSLKERVQKVLQSDQGKVEGSSTISKSSFGLIGTLQKVVGSTLQIVTIQGPTRIAELEKGATIVRQGKQIEIADLELNSPVIVTGTLDADNTYHVLRLSAESEQLTQSPRATIYGTIDSVTTRAFTLSVLAGTDAPKWILPYTSKTAFYDLLDTKIEKKYVKASLPVMAIVPGDLSATSSAVRIYVMTPVSTGSAATR